jgi:trehalose 6-phosphate synthase/phosphatase
LDGGSPYDFILAMGDDLTNEELFKALPERAWTIRVGDGGASPARYSVSGPGEVRRLLRALT